jgi:hypothetical protein
MLNKNEGKIGKRIKTRCLLALILGYFISIPCLSSGEDMMPYSKFKEINIDFWKSIQTGTIEARFSNYELADQNIMAERAWERKERIKNKIMSDSNLSSEEKESCIQQLERTNREIDMPRIRHASDTKEIFRFYTFDLTEGKSRIKEIHSDANAFGKGIAEQIILTSRDGNQLSYFSKIEQAALGQISTRGFSFQSSILYLGVISPERFEKLPENDRAWKDKINGQDVVVYELSDDVNHPGYKFIIYADPSIGYRYIQLEWLSQGKIVQRIVAKNYKVFDGVPFPAYHEDTSYAKDGAFLKRKIIEVNEAHFNCPIEPDTFSIMFTPDTKVSAHLDGKFTRFKTSADKKSQMSLEEIVSQAKNSPQTETILLK